jgi:HAD superfamily hydrolase (TIGR01509 family)
MSKFQAIIFDMDGVIVESESHWRGVEAEFLASLIPDWSSSDQQKILGMSVRDVHKLLHDSYCLDISFDDYLGHYNALADDIYGIRSQLLDGADELIRRLHEAGVCLGLASSSPRNWIEIVLERFGFRSMFKTVVSSDDINGPSKPSPEIYLLAAKRLNLQPKSCVAIEDSPKGVASAVSAGMFCIGLHSDFEFSQNLDKCDLQVSGYEELSKAISNLGII